LTGVAGTPRTVSGTVIGRSRSEAFASVERRISRVTALLDDLVAIPGTKQRFGLDPLIGLIPGVGDMTTAIVGGWIILEAARMRIPGIVLARMILNTTVDLVIGAIPLVGDLFDVVSRSNHRNLQLFRRYATDERASTTEHRLFFAGLVLVLVGALWLGWQVIAWMWGQVFGRI
jgi:hypothetical protein